MKMILNHNGSIITLNETEQEMVYEFYRLYSLMERMDDVIDTNELNINYKIKFKSEDDKATVAKRIIELIDDYHSSESDAMKIVFEDTDYMQNYIIS